MEATAAGTVGAKPLISVIMASYCAGRHIEAALDSVLAQTQGDLEVIVCDDASSDDTVDVVTQVMRRDPRVRLVALMTNGGPARARNRTLDEASGEWMAIVDADDLLHRERFERMLAAAAETGADIVADDLQFFDEGARATERLLEGDAFASAQPLTAELFVGGKNAPAMGYLKPMIRASLLEGERYDETLRIGEDFDLLLRLLLGGARGWLIPQPWYRYRRHGASISHRLSPEALEGMIASAHRLAAGAAAPSGDVRHLLAGRIASLESHLAYARLVETLKDRNIAQALLMLAKRPSLALELGAWGLGKLRVQGARAADEGGAVP